VKKPSDSNSSNADIDWDKLAKPKMPLDSEVCRDTHTVPPPLSYEPQSAALKPTLGDPHDTVLSERKRRVKDTDRTDAASGGKCMKFFKIKYIDCFIISVCFNYNTDIALQTALRYK